MNLSRISDNTFLIDQGRQFASGSLDQLVLHSYQGQKELVLAKTGDVYARQGSFVSPVIAVPAFTRMLLSWNGQTPQSTYLELQARVKAGSGWSTWLSWGKWGRTIASASVVNDTNPLAQVDTDTLIMKGNKSADQIQIRAWLHSDHTTLTPSLRMIAVSVLTNDLLDERSSLPLNKKIAVPAYSQLQRDPKLAPNICSPTTLTMAMNRLGENLLVEEVAYEDYDYVYEGFGNWAFNMALAGSYGFQAYAEFTTIDGLKKEIAAGNPVGVSVQYTNDPADKSLPFLENAHGPTHGHLLLVRGFQQIDGQEYVLVNDPFESENAASAKAYKLPQFRRAWITHMAYVIHRQQQPVFADNSRSRIPALLRPTDEKNVFALYLGERHLRLPPAFTAESDPLKLTSGTLAYSLTADPQDHALSAEKIYYTHETKSGDIYLDLTHIKKQAADKKGHLTLYVIDGMNKTYVAQMPVN